MSRLTEFRKDLNRYEYKQDERGYCFIQEGQIVQKLGKLEDLEEQLGCPLEVVFKAIYSGIYYIYPNGNIVLERSFKLNHYSSGWCLIKPKLNFKLEDYKKTWWLKRDKSE